jgi:hypothetical protein
MTAISAPRATASELAANPFPDLSDSRALEDTPQPARPRGPTPRRFPSPRFGDYSRTRFESRVAFGGPDEDAEEVVTPTRQFSLLEITSRLPHDSRETDEKQAERRLRSPSIDPWTERVPTETGWIAANCLSSARAGRGRLTKYQV